MTSVANQLSVVRDANVEALQIWLRTQEHNVTQAARSQAVNNWARRLIDMSGDPAIRPHQLLESEEHKVLVTRLEPWMSEDYFAGFIVLSVDWKIVASNHTELVGKTATKQYGLFLDRVIGGETTVSRPFPSSVILPDSDGVERAGVPTMYSAAPLVGSEGVFGVLAFRIRPDLDFTRILQVGRMGDSGETYAFDEEGLLLSESRFDSELKSLGLIPDEPNSRSILKLTLRDPLVDLTTGQRAPASRSELKLTVPIARAISSRGVGVDVTGYRDYFGIPTVGAWTWLDGYGFGVITEVNRDEAFRPVTVVRRVFWGLFTLLAVSFAAASVIAWLLGRWRRTAQQAVLAARQLGQYTLDTKVGAGGMGTVYRAHHSMLRRPTAVKLLDEEKANEVTIRRFEREVQLTSQLNHPNTVAIYDFGRTPEGVFYYAMEFLDGLTLQDLVMRFGPQPEGRVIEILRQVCGSLSEAHEMGLIHRDIKPANILINRRGGLCDFVKVVDFGLVKSASPNEVTVTQANAITGTPLYMAPETIEKSEDVDHRADIYAVGAVGYFLLTGTTVFQAENLFDLFRKQATEIPEPPSQRCQRTLHASLERVLLSCLAKDPAARPQSARELEEQLEDCTDVPRWTALEAQQWWRDYDACKVSATVSQTRHEQSGATIIANPAS